MTVLITCGFSLALESTGHFQTIGFVENDEYCQAVLRHHFPEVPILGDIKNVTKETVPTRPDVLCGGFPCQPFSVAGDQRAKDDPRHLWPEMLRIIKEQKPTWVVGEKGHFTCQCRKGVVPRGLTPSGAWRCAGCPR